MLDCMETESGIKLRLRFFKDIEGNVDLIREKFSNYKKIMPSDFVMKIRDNYIQFTFSAEKQHYWSPHLSIVLEEMEGNEKTQHTSEDYLVQPKPCGLFLCFYIF